MIYPNCEWSARNIGSPFNEEEIKAAVYVLATKKAPGPDGFPIMFFRRFWDIVKGDILKLFTQFFNSDVDLRCLNYALMTLALKKEGTSVVNEFLPISLLNVVFKIITKILANRPRSHIYLLIDQVQSAFTKNLYILGSVACANEILVIFHGSNIEAVFLKLDFEKTFNSVSWGFLFKLLLVRGFGHRWLGVIKACLLSGTSSILINGKPSNYIQCRRGISQGDPLSPYLFILVANSLIKILSLSDKNGRIQKVSIFPWPNYLVSLHYANDTILLVLGDVRSLTRLKVLLYGFEMASGLKNQLP